MVTFMLYIFYHDRKTLNKENEKDATQRGRTWKSPLSMRG
jgi:hypothetical protein